MNDLFLKIPTIPGHVTTRTLGDEAVVMDLKTLHTFTLNETAKAVWGLVDGKRTVDDIIGRLLADYDVAADECRENVVELVDTLTKECLLILAVPSD